jgi:nickel/cobalt transporter (NicO) family protein
VAIGVAGGLLPSPSALLVLLSTAAAGHAWYGVALVAAFGAGMALTLTAAGLLVARLRDRAERRVRRPQAGRSVASRALATLLRYSAPITAIAVLLLGLAVALRAATTIAG